MSSDGYKTALFVLQKVICFFSSVGSLMIISQVSRNKFNRRKTQQRLVLGISMVDFLVSIVWIFTNLFVPPSSGMLYARGTQATCDAQGFIVQLLSTGILYMVALQVFYLLTIKYGWKDKDIRKIEPYMHFFSIGYGLATATTALVLNLINPANWDCWIAPYPPDCTSTYEIKRGYSDLEETDCIRGDNAQLFQWGFLFAPLWLTIVVCMAIMIIVIREIRSIEEKSNRWKRKSQIQMKYTKEVMFQSLLYTGGFFTVWTFPTLSRLIQLFGGELHPILEVLSGSFIGSQGIFNAIIYFRPRYKKCTKKGILRKLWALVHATLFFCCYDEDYTNDKKDVLEDAEGTTTVSTGHSSSNICSSNTQNIHCGNGDCNNGAADRQGSLEIPSNCRKIVKFCNIGEEVKYEHNFSQVEMEKLGNEEDEWQDNALTSDHAQSLGHGSLLGHGNNVTFIPL